MRRSERAAVAAVAAMTLPGILAILAVPTWFVVRAWPTMDAVDRSLFAMSVVSFALSIGPVFGRRLRLLHLGHLQAFTPFELILLLAPLAVAWWAVAHDWSLTAWIGGAWIAIRLQMSIEEGLKDRPVRPPRQKPPDRIEPRLTLASVVEPRIPRRWKDRYGPVAWRRPSFSPRAGRYGPPPDPPNGDP